jgi:hypothetical protein
MVKIASVASSYTKGIVGPQGKWEKWGEFRFKRVNPLGEVQFPKS